MFCSLYSKSKMHYLIYSIFLLCVHTLQWDIVKIVIDVELCIWFNQSNGKQDCPRKCVIHIPRVAHKGFKLVTLTDLILLVIIQF